MAEKQIVGIVEEIILRGKESVKTTAVFDTGARMTSVDVRLAAKAMLGPIVKTTKVSNPSLKTQIRRPVVEAEISILDRKFNCLVNIQDREHMTFPVIIGRNIINGNFIVDTKKNQDLHEEKVKEKNARRKQAKV
ncbi:MAG: ATP-dependent zinc protease [Candidatus Aenigmarchaeota archaeon]|nr:ATP-dependent zinc protease [Candidatus Aenigmarchaeota archaeon]